MQHPKQGAESIVPTPVGDTFGAEIGAQDRDNSDNAILDIDELSFSAIHHIVSTTLSRIGGIVACIDSPITPPADFDSAESTTRFFATIDSIDDLFPEANDEGDEDLCALFDSLGINGNFGEWSASPSFDDFCNSFQTLAISPSASDVSLQTFSRHVHLASTPTATDRIIGHSAYPSFTEDPSFIEEDLTQILETDSQSDGFEDSSLCALPTSDSIPNVVTMESASSFTSMSDYDDYDADSECSHDGFCIVDASTGSLSDLAECDDDSDVEDFDENFKELEPSPSFGTFSPILAPRLHQCINPMFLSLISRRVTDITIVQDGAFGGPIQAQANQSSSHATPVPLASRVGLRTLSHFSGSGASTWSPFAPNFASPLSSSRSLQFDVD